MYRLGWDYPLHLGVTEAGEGEDGRMKSAIGIGTLLADGLGDTIRVSLTEDPEYEYAPCNRLAELASLELSPERGAAQVRLAPVPPHCAQPNSMPKSLPSPLTCSTRGAARRRRRCRPSTTRAT